MNARKLCIALRHHLSDQFNPGDDVTILGEDNSVRATKLAEATEFGSLASLIPS